MNARIYRLPCAAISASATCLALLLALPGLAQAAAGRIQFVHGEVRVIDATGQERAARKGEELQEGDTIVTGKAGAAQVRMVDGGFIAVRPDTRLKVDTFRYAGKTDGSEKGVFTLVKGTFRAITGAVGSINKENYEVRTPGATIGIRGTDHEPMFIPAPLAGEMPPGPPGTYDKVNVGEAFIKTPAGVAFIAANHAGYAASASAVPITLPRIPEFFKPAPPAPKAEQRPGAQQARPAGPAPRPGSAPPPSNGAAPPPDGAMPPPPNGSAPPPPNGTMPPPPPSGTLATTSGTLPPPLLPPPPIAPNTIIQPISTSGGGVPLATFGATTHAAPLWSGGVGGDMWINELNEWDSGSGALIIDGQTGKNIQLDGANNMVSVADVNQTGGSFQFSSGSAVLVAPGSRTLLDNAGNALATITWGRWEGGFAVIDRGVLKRSIGSFHYMYSPSVTTPTQMQNITASNSYSYIAGTGGVTDQYGQAGGITSISATVNFGQPAAANAVTYRIDASTPGRTWSATGSGTLPSFTGGTSSTALNGTCSGGGCATSNGQASGLFVGPAAQAAITSFNLDGRDSAGSVVGSMNGVGALRCTNC